MGKAMSLISKNALILLLIFTSSCCKDCKRLGGTPTKYKYRIKGVTHVEYSSDTIAIQRILTKMLDKRIKPLDLKTYDEKTVLFIDSLVYSPDKLRMIVFVITRNSTMKMLHRENDAPFFYDAYYLFCSRDSLNKPIKVYSRAGFGLINFYDYAEIREALHKYCFNQLLKLDGTTQHYNIDDVRFWKSKDFELVLRNSPATSE